MVDVFLELANKLKDFPKEVEKALEITNIRTIKKNTLSPEDALYDEDALIVVHHHKSQYS